MSTFILSSEKEGHLDIILINCNISVSTSVGFVGNLWKSEVRSHFEPGSVLFEAKVKVGR